MERRAYAPGDAGRRRVRESEYRIQMREKQKAKRIYGMLEKQFHAYYQIANAKNGVTGEVLLQLLETRLDNVVYRLGFAKSRAEARQQVRHGHVQVNGKRVTIPSYRVRPGDAVSIAEKAREMLVIQSAIAISQKVEVPEWLEVDVEKFVGNVLSIPAREQIDSDINEQLIVELYSK
jgi:small subunit ribosomal protein S4